MPARVRFAFKDILEMQRKGWLARREEEKAKKLSEFRQEGLSISVSAGNLNTMAPSPKTGGNTPGPHKGRGSQDARNYNDGNNSPSLNQPKSPSGEWQDVRKSERGGAKKGSSLAGGPPTAGKMRGSQSMSQLNDGKTIPNARKTQDARGRPQSTTLLSKQAAANNDSASKPPLQKENSSTSVESEPIDIAEDVEFAEISLPGDVKSRMRGQVNEYLATSMENEFAEVFSSLLTKENAASLVKEFFVIAVDLKESEREKLWHLLPFLYTSKNLTSAAIITGVTFFVNVLEDLICDAPKANIYLASLLAPLCVEAEGAAFSGSLGFILKATYERPEEIILPTVAQVEKTHAELAQQIYKNTIASASDEQKEALRQVAEKFSCQTAIGLL